MLQQTDRYTKSRIDSGPPTKNRHQGKYILFNNTIKSVHFYYKLKSSKCYEILSLAKDKSHKSNKKERDGRSIPLGKTWFLGGTSVNEKE